MKTVFIISFVFFLSIGEAAVTKVRIGWQIPWAIQGQIVSVLKNTDVLKKNGIEATFVGRTFGPELNELALANEVDLILTADQPAVVLFSKDRGWVGISRLMYNRTSTYVPIDSEIKSLTDLKGKMVGVPFGAAAQRIIYKALEEKGIDPKKDTSFINVGMLEQDALIKKTAKNSKKWDQFDALVGFDPLPAKFEALKQARMIHEGKVVALVVANESFLKKNPNFAKNFNTALFQSYEFYRTHLSQVNSWYVKDAKLNYFNDEIFKITSKFEPNLIPKNDIRISFDAEDFKILNEASAFVEKNILKRIDMTKYVFNKDIFESKTKVDQK